MASEKSKERLNEEVTAAPNAATFSPMLTIAPIARNNQLPPKQLPVKKLQGRENRSAWLNVLTASAKDLGFWNVITGEEVKPKDPTKLQKWKQKDLYAMELIFESISQEMRVDLDHKKFNPITVTSKDLLALVLVSILTEPEIERLELGEKFHRRFNPIDRHSFVSTEAYIADLLEEWTSIKAKYPDAPDKWLNMVAITGLESLNETDDEPPLFFDIFDHIKKEEE
ncbi:hypothetical protein ACHAPV_008224 [Trichoderma viride]